VGTHGRVCPFPKQRALDLHESIEKAYISLCHNVVIDDTGRELLRVNLLTNVYTNYTTHMTSERPTSPLVMRESLSPYNLRKHPRNSNA
jgi:hypothetical protein